MAGQASIDQMTNSNSGTPKSAYQGFSLIELLVVVAMIAVVSAIATPSLQSFLISSDIRSVVNDWTFALQRTKSEAIKQNRQVTLCPSASGTSCTATTAYEVGWIIKTGTTASVAGDRIIADYMPLNRLTITSNKGNAAAAITYLPNGLPIGNFTGMRITIMENAEDPRSMLTRYICVARTGRARVFNEEQYLSLPNNDCE